MNRRAVALRERGLQRRQVPCLVAAAVVAGLTREHRRLDVGGAHAVDPHPVRARAPARATSRCRSRRTSRRCRSRRPGRRPVRSRSRWRRSNPATRSDAGIAERHAKNVPLRFTSMVRSHCSSVMSAVGPSTQTPAVQTSTSRPPRRSTVPAPPCVRSRPPTVTSAVTVSTSPSRAAASARPSSVRSASITVSPSARNRAAIARPIPPAPPVIRTTRRHGVSRPSRRRSPRA